MATKMYNALAKYYDLEYKWKDYGAESKAIHNFIRKYKKAPGKELLDVGCGTGKHDIYLKRWYRITGIDLSPQMLAIAKKNVKGVKYLSGNMQTFRLNKKFDAIACLFSAFNYNITKAQMQKTLKNFYRHLKPGGVAIFDLFTLKMWRKGYTTFDIFTDKDIKIVRIAKNKSKDFAVKLIFTYYIIDKKENKKHKTYPNTAIKLDETHAIGVFDNKVVASLAKQAGFRKIIQLAALNKAYKRPVFILVK